MNCEESTFSDESSNPVHGNAEPSGEGIGVKFYNRSSLNRTGPGTKFSSGMGVRQVGHRRTSPIRKVRAIISPESNWIVLS